LKNFIKKSSRGKIVIIRSLDLPVIDEISIVRAYPENHLMKD